MPRKNTSTSRYSSSLCSSTVVPFIGENPKQGMPRLRKNLASVDAGKIIGCILIFLVAFLNTPAHGFSFSSIEVTLDTSARWLNDTETPGHRPPFSHRIQDSISSSTSFVVTVGGTRISKMAFAVGGITLFALWTPACRCTILTLRISPNRMPPDASLTACSARKAATLAKMDVNVRVADDDGNVAPWPGRSFTSITVQNGRRSP
mmetsp:Transcript_16641/g.29152  ORF Transcript_16641/g.29152 Transcript_16641/m.29152 type:complete len:205 (+) Transcript_16641:83-697(+)